MHDILRLLKLIGILGLCPYLCGYMFHSIMKERKSIFQIFFQYVCGFFVMLALFEVVGVPAIYMGIKFHVLVCLYSVILVGVMIVSLSVMIQKKVLVIKLSGILDYIKALNCYEWIYLILFVVLLGVQIYGGIRYSSTYNSLDDATYVAYAQDAIDTDSMLQHNPNIGSFQNVNMHRAWQSSLIFNAYISKVTGVSVTSLMHTVFYVLLLIMAYMVYSVVASQLFDRRENRLIFLDLVALLYIWGNYSHYSLTFRLLGVIWQGKAILAVILVPLLFAMLYQLQQQDYCNKNGFLLMILSIAATSLTLMGTVTFLFIITTLIVLGRIRSPKYEKRKYLYVLWGCIVPVIVAGGYLIDHIA